MLVDKEKIKELLEDEKDSENLILHIVFKNGLIRSFKFLSSEEKEKFKNDYILPETAIAIS
jgi:hypothetical protein